MVVRILSEPFDPWQTVQAHQRAHLASGSYGATALFVGTMRDFNQGDTVQAMNLEHYPGMTERFLEQISRQAAERWDILDSLICHRVGPLNPDDPIVLVAVWSAHRADAFDASRWLMEELKSRAPFWKKEVTTEGERWVENEGLGTRN